MSSTNFLVVVGFPWMALCPWSKLSRHVTHVSAFGLVAPDSGSHNTTLPSGFLELTSIFPNSPMLDLVAFLWPVLKSL
jgi:hypothetical protein